MHTLGYYYCVYPNFGSERDFKVQDFVMINVGLLITKEQFCFVLENGISLNSLISVCPIGLNRLVDLFQPIEYS